MVFEPRASDDSCSSHQFSHVGFREFKERFAGSPGGSPRIRFKQTESSSQRRSRAASEISESKPIPSHRRPLIEFLTSLTYVLSQGGGLEEEAPRLWNLQASKFAPRAFWEGL